MKTKILADFQICISVPLSKETNDNTDVFTEGIESPCCASIPYDCLKTLESKVNEIYELSSSTKDAQIKDARQLEKVTESIMFINEKFEEYEVDIKEKEKNSRIKSRFGILERKIGKTLDCQNLYSRRNCLLVH